MVILISVLKLLVKNPIKESFNKEKKKKINILTIFSFLIKIMSKFFLIKFLTNILKHLLTLFGKKYPNNINETNSPSPQCLEKCVQVYFGQ